MYVKKGKVIAIDGPAGTGKSSVSNALASDLGFHLIHTGRLYRAIAWAYLKNNDFFHENDAILTESAIHLANSLSLEFKIIDKKTHLFVNQQDITQEIHDPVISSFASHISAIPGVRKALFGLQRFLGCQSDSILEGRDIGTIIFPDADIKFYLFADLHQRAKRRFLELTTQGIGNFSLEEVKNQISQRDEEDQNRVIAPLEKAKDAIFIDSTSLSFPEVVSQMRSFVKQHLGI